MSYAIEILKTPRSEYQPDGEGPFNYIVMIVNTSGQRVTKRIVDIAEIPEADHGYFAKALHHLKFENYLSSNCEVIANGKTFRRDPYSDHLSLSEYLELIAKEL